MCQRNRWTKKWMPLYNDDTMIDVLNLLLELRV
jgi:hypothetical protein